MTCPFHGGFKMKTTFSCLLFMLCWLLGVRPVPMPGVPATDPSCEPGRGLGALRVLVKTSLEGSGFRWLLRQFLYSEIPTTWSRKPTNDRARERNGTSQVEHTWKVCLPPFSTRDCHCFLCFLIFACRNCHHPAAHTALLFPCPRQSPTLPSSFPTPFCVLPLGGSLLRLLHTDRLTVISQADSRSPYAQGVQLVYCLCLLSSFVLHLPPPPS